jgi:F420-non-reducing hydrogenase small subunit
MARKVKLAINWAAACGGCDVAILDLEDALLELANIAEIVYWPVAMDFKRQQLRQLAPGSVDVGIFNGAVRTSEQEEDALLMREKSRVLVACGSCACFGGIPGLANASTRERLLQTVYSTTASTDNPEEVRPTARHDTAGVSLELPELLDTVRPLHQVVDVDLFLPGCPPPLERVQELLAVIEALGRDALPPPKGTFLASTRALCEECPRGGNRRREPIGRFVRVHQVPPTADTTTCLLELGIACAGLATRGGCGASCIRVNMPCRGCFGPLPDQLDPAAELASALAALAGPRGNWELPVHQIVGPARSLPDPLGTLYRFTYPVSIGRRTLARDGRGGNDG